MRRIDFMNNNYNSLENAGKKKNNQRSLNSRTEQRI